MNNSNNIQRYSSFSKAFSSIAFLLISSYSYSQTYTDYYFIPTTGGNATLDLAENYTVGSPDGEVASEIPRHNTNVFISANDDGYGYTANTNYHNFNAHNVTFKVGDAGTGGGGAWFLLTENCTASITGDFLFSARNVAEWTQAESGVKVLTNSNFSVTGDFIIENNNIADADNAGFKFAFKHHSTDHTNGSVFIGGNLLFRSVNNGTTYATERIEFITKVTNFSVNGYVDLTQPIVRGSENNLIWDLKGGGDSGLGDTGKIQIGGLRGDGALKLSKESSTVNMEFSNSQNYEWAGTLSMIDGSRLNITMYANDSNAKQTLRFGAGSEDLAHDDPLKNSTRHTPDSVTVERGILEMNTSDNVCGTLAVIGREAAFGATGVSSAYEDGRISFASVNWSSGGFIFDIIPNIASGDVINAVVVDGVENSGTITVADGASDLKMTFNLSAEDLQQFLFDEGLESYESTIMTWETSSNLGDYLDDIQILSDNGVNVDLSISGNSLVATFTVPEPHETAALIGAIALFAVLARRRMRR